MPDSRKHRGPHPQDRKLFAEDRLPALREAVHDLSWLLSRSYKNPSALKMVGDRLKLTARQRVAVGRCACSDADRENRESRRASLDRVRSGDLLIDGFNLLTTIEAALAGGILIRGRDGCIRDMSSMHGNYRVLDDTEMALDLIFLALRRLGTRRAIWYLDKPVSNSGQLKTFIRGIAGDFPSVITDVRLVKDPDPLLIRAKGDVVIATADSGILDRCGSWINLTDYVITILIGEAEILDLDSETVVDPPGTSAPAPSSAASAEKPAIREITAKTEWLDPIQQGWHCHPTLFDRTFETAFSDRKATVSI